MKYIWKNTFYKITLPLHSIRHHFMYTHSLRSSVSFSLSFLCFFSSWVLLLLSSLFRDADDYLRSWELKYIKKYLIYKQIYLSGLHLAQLFRFTYSLSFFPTFFCDSLSSFSSLSYFLFFLGGWSVLSFSWRWWPSLLLCKGRKSS